MRTGFLDQLQTPVTEERRLATQLYEALKAKRLYQGRNPNLTAWAEQLRLLQTKDGVHANDVADVVDWYCDHAKEEFVPIVSSAKWFRKRFQEVKRAMDRKKSDGGDLKLCPEVVQLIKELGLLWPQGEKEKAQEAAFIQTTWNNYERYIRRIRELAAEYRQLSDEWPPSKPNGRFSHVELGLLFAELNNTNIWTPDFVSYWVRDIHSMAWKWGNWNGELRSFTFRVDSRRFTEHLFNRVVSYRGNRYPTVTKALVEHIIELVQYENRTA